jgi:hypothetical protein
MGRLSPFLHSSAKNRVTLISCEPMHYVVVVPIADTGKHCNVRLVNPLLFVGFLQGAIHASGTRKQQKPWNTRIKPRWGVYRFT